MNLKKVPDGLVVKNTSLGYTFKLALPDVNFLRRAVSKNCMLYREDIENCTRILCVNGLTDNYQFTIERPASPVLIYELTPNEIGEILIDNQKRKIA